MQRRKTKNEKNKKKQKTEKRKEKRNRKKRKRNTEKEKKRYNAIGPAQYDPRGARTFLTPALRRV